jgi:Zn-finger nucleic acid-binding protein
MQHDQIHDVHIDRCAEHGIWLDRSEFFQITEAERKKATDMDVFVAELRKLLPKQGRPDERGTRGHGRDLACPISGAPMVTDLYEDVYIDRSQAGIWLDNGELELIVERLRQDPSFLRGIRIRIQDASM